MCYYLHYITPNCHICFCCPSNSSCSKHLFFLFPCWNWQILVERCNWSLLKRSMEMEGTPLRFPCWLLFSHLLLAEKPRVFRVVLFLPSSLYLSFKKKKKKWVSLVKWDFSLTSFVQFINTNKYFAFVLEPVQWGLHILSYDAKVFHIILYYMSLILWNHSIFQFT